MNHPIPFMKASNVIAPKKTARDAPDLEEAIEEEDDADVLEPAEVDEDDDIDLKKDKYIKQPKAKAAPKKTKKKAADDDDDDIEPPAKKTGGKGKAAAAKGKAKK